jgi:copper(I)-binding protein
MEPQISIEGPYAVLSEIIYGSASVFMNIRNTGGRDALVSAAVDIPGAVVEMHDIDGKRMFKVNRLAVPARGVLELKPLGRHLMLFNMPRSVQAGSTAMVQLVFERSGVKNIPMRFMRSGDIPENR